MLLVMQRLNGHKLIPHAIREMPALAANGKPPRTFAHNWGQNGLKLRTRRILSAPEIT
jgi:hypothetical protein